MMLHYLVMKVGKWWGNHESEKTANLKEERERSEEEAVVIRSDNRSFWNEDFYEIKWSEQKYKYLRIWKMRERERNSFCEGEVGFVTLFVSLGSLLW